MNETNRTAIVLLAGLWIVFMGVVAFLTWAAPDDVLERVGDLVEYLYDDPAVAGDDRLDAVGQLIITLGALLLSVLALLVIIVELAPEEESRELRVEQAGATTIVPAEALRQRLEQALLALPQVTAVKARVFSRDKGIGSTLDLTITPDANVAGVTQEASRVVVDTLQTDLGLPASGLPTVRIVFGGPKAEPVASSVVRPPVEPLAAPAVEEAPARREASEAAPSPPEPEAAAPAASEEPSKEEAPGEPQP